MVGKIATRESTDNKFKQPRKHHSSNSITHRLPDKHRKNFMKRKRKPLKLNTNSLPSFDHIFKSDCAKGNSDVMNVPQVTPQQVQPISIHQARENLLRALSVKVQAGLTSGNLPIPGRHLPIHGSHLQDGKKGWVHLKMFKRFPLQATAIPMYATEV